MKNKIIKKLRSRTGASITFALLLFLVCAVLCSVIIAAATAAAGRMSKIAENDQRYYAVTSAAGVIKDLFEGNPVSIVEIKRTETDSSHVISDDSDTPGGWTPDEVHLIVNKKANEIKEEDLSDSNLIGNVTTDNLQIDAAKKAVINGNSDISFTTISDRQLTLALSGVDKAKASTVTVTEDMTSNGTIALTLFNTYKANGTDSAPGNRYTLIMQFDPDISVSTDTKTENITSGGSLKIKKTEIRITTITWNLAHIRQ